MSTQRDSQRIEDLAYQLWEEEGRPHGRHEEHWAEAERRLSNADEDGLASDAGAHAKEQDTPGRPKSASSRQQTQPGQSTLTGSASLDAKGASSPGRRHR